jgi:3-dehydroquinate synthetase
MSKDKKVRDGKVTFILSRGIGKAFIAPGVDLAMVEAALQDAAVA